MGLVFSDGIYLIRVHFGEKFKGSQVKVFFWISFA
jgi:hypothetical protein